VPWLVLLLLSVAAEPAGATIRYSISLAQRAGNRFHVRMEVPDVGDELTVEMPVWNGLYQVRDFAQSIEQLHAETPSGESIALYRTSPHSWRAVPAAGACKENGTPVKGGPCAHTVILDYRVLRSEPGPYSSEINASHAFLNFATVLLYAPVRRSEAVEVEFRDVPAGWRLASALSYGPGESTLAAANYDDLADAPVEIGVFDDFSFEAAGSVIRVVLYVSGEKRTLPSSWSRARLEDTVRRVVTTQTSLMHDTPFSRFLFLLRVGPGGGDGGMEHANSTAIALPAETDPAPYIAHEFFHLWNVKRIRPQSLEPVDYENEQPTDALWFAEGVTSTYAAYTLVRSGLWSRRIFYADLARQIDILNSRPARFWQSAEDSSLAAWLEKYPLYRASDVSISYYNKGQLIGVCLDILLRDSTGNRIGLDDLMRDLNDRYAKQHRFYPDSVAIRTAAERLSGKDFSDFFRRHVAGTDEIPFQEILAKAGLELHREVRSPGNPGFSATVSESEGLLVSDIVPGGPADLAGLHRGDRILEINGVPASKEPGAWFESVELGPFLRLRLKRDERPQEVSFTPVNWTVWTYSIRESGRSERASQIREGILTRTSQPLR
jgi:predicted metalloprotease with PDZ domain